MQAPKPPRRDPVELENENQQLREQLDQSQRRIEQLERDKQNLNRNIERLKKELETARRSAKRAAAPFSRGNPKVSPKTPGRKPGARYGRHHHRPRPSQVDEQIGVDLPSQCLSLGHTAETLAVGFGLHRSRGALYQALARLADKAMPTYQGLVQAARQSLVNRVDETGWRVGGVPWYLWVFVSDEVTVYAILPGRGFQQAASVLGAEYRGWLLHDGWIAYYLFLLACHQSCLEHLIRRC